MRDQLKFKFLVASIEANGPTATRLGFVLAVLALVCIPTMHDPVAHAVGIGAKSIARAFTQPASETW